MKSHASCTKCYWYSPHAHNSGDPDVCSWDQNELWDIIEDTSKARECFGYIEKSEADKLIRGYCRVMAASPKIPEPEFKEEEKPLLLWSYKDTSRPLTPIQMFYED